MTFTPIPDGTTNWGFVLNNALNDIQAQISTNLAAASTGDWTPEDNGMIAWTMDPYVSSSSRTFLSGVVQLHMVSIKKPATINNILLSRSVVGVGLTNCFAGIYNINGTLIGQTADQSANWLSGGTTPLTMPLTAQLPVQAGKYWIALLGTGSTMPTFLGGPGGAGGHYNLGTTSATRRLATFGTGLAALPASITPTSMTGVTGNPICLSLS